MGGPRGPREGVRPAAPKPPPPETRRARSRSTSARSRSSPSTQREDAELVMTYQAPDPYLVLGIPETATVGGDHRRPPPAGEAPSPRPALERHPRGPGALRAPDARAQHRLQRAAPPPGPLGSTTQTSSSPRWSWSDRTVSATLRSFPSHTTIASSTLRASHASRRLSDPATFCFVSGALALELDHRRPACVSSPQPSRTPSRGTAGPRRTAAPRSPRRRAAPACSVGDDRQVGVHLVLRPQDVDQLRRADPRG